MHARAILAELSHAVLCGFSRTWVFPGRARLLAAWSCWSTSRCPGRGSSAGSNRTGQHRFAGGVLLERSCLGSVREEMKTCGRLSRGLVENETRSIVCGEWQARAKRSELGPSGEALGAHFPMSVGTLGERILRETAFGEWAAPGLLERDRRLGPRGGCGS